MKKRLISTIIALATAISCMGITAVSVSAEDTAVETFDNQTLETLPAGWSLRLDGTNNTAPAVGGVAGEENGKKFLRVKPVNIAGRSHGLVSPSATSNDFSMEFDLRISSIKDDVIIGLVPGNGSYTLKPNYYNKILADGKKFVKMISSDNVGSGESQGDVQLDDNTWFKVKYVVHCQGENAKADVYINGKYSPLASGAFLTNAEVRKLCIYQISKNDATATIDIDNFKITDLTGDDLGTIPAGWTGDISKGAAGASMGIVEDDNNKFLRLHVGKGGTAWMMSPMAESNKFEVSFKIRVATAGPLRLSCVGESGDYNQGEFKTQFWDKHVAVKYSNDKSNDNNKFIATPQTTTVVGEWHTVKFIIDTTGAANAWREEVYFDGEYKRDASGILFVNTSGKLNRLKLEFNNPITGGQQVEGTVDIDDFKITDIAPIPEGWELRSDGKHIAGGIIEENGESFLRLNPTIAKGTSYMRSPLATSNKFSMEFDLRLSKIEDDTDMGLVAYDGDRKKGYYQNQIKWWLKSELNMNCKRIDNLNTGNAEGDSIGEVKENEWFHIKYEARCEGANDENASVKLYVNNQYYPKGSGTVFATKGAVSRLEIFRQPTVEGVTVDIKNFKITELKDYTFTSEAQTEVKDNSRTLRFRTEFETSGLESYKYGFFLVNFHDAGDDYIEKDKVESGIKTRDILVGEATNAPEGGSYHYDITGIPTDFTGAAFYAIPWVQPNENETWYGAPFGMPKFN